MSFTESVIQHSVQANYSGLVVLSCYVDLLEHAYTHSVSNTAVPN